MLRTVSAIVVILLLATTAASHLTDGFSGWTSESLRRQRIAAQPRSLPELELIDANGKHFQFGQATRHDGKYVLLDFIYTHCVTVCSTLGNEFQQLQQQIALHGLTDRVSLLSISFDPAHDTPDALHDYADRMHADPAIWRFASATDPAQLQALLTAAGIVVIPDGYGGWTHNAAIHVVLPDGRLARIFDVDAFDHALALVAGSARP